MRSAHICASRSIRPDIVWRYAGVRPLLDDGASKAQEATRDYVLELSAPADAAPLLSVFGGKITTYRRLAEAAMARLARFFPGMHGAWTTAAALPGGDFPWDAVGVVCSELRGRYRFLSGRAAGRLVRDLWHRGAARCLATRATPPTWGSLFGADLTEREVEWLVRNEWARTADDVLWRRSKLGLRLDAAEAAALSNYLSATVE